MTLSLAAALPSSSWHSPGPTVVFVGDGPAKGFAPWSKFCEAWDAVSSEARPPAQLVYLETPPLDIGIKRAAIASAVQHGAQFLVTPTGNSAQIAAAVAGRAAVVFATFFDPIRAGFAQSDRHPGGRLTGISLADFLDAKRLQILLDAFPATRRVGVLTDYSWAEHYQGEERILRDAAALGLEATMYYCSTVNDIDRLMSSRAADSEQAWYVMPTTISYFGEARIAAHLARLRAPGMFTTESEMRRGAALAYVADASFVYPKMAELVARVVAGEDPAHIPIERPRRYLLLARAGALQNGQPISARLLRRADRIFEPEGA